MTPVVLESLPARRLCAAGVADLAFGQNGIAELDANTTGITRVIPATGGLLVAQTTSNGSLLTRLTDAGQIDTDWGDDGQVALSLTADQIAFDKRTGRVYVAGIVKPADEARYLEVCRLAADGHTDTAFGTAGTAVFAPVSTLPNEDSFFAIDIEHLTVLRNGGVLVAAELRSGSGSSDDSVPHSYDRTDDQNAVLVKFRDNGRRDRAFGRRGVTVVAVGSGSAGGDDYDAYSTGDEPVIRTVTPLADGGYDVLFTRRSFEADSQVPETNHDQFDVGRQTVTAAGTLGTLANWRVYETDANYPFRFGGLVDRGTRIVVAGTLSARKDSGQDEDRLYDLLPDGSVRSGTLISGNDLGLDADATVFSDRRGGLYTVTGQSASGVSPTVRHLLRNGRTDPAFGRRGTVALGVNVIPFAVDADGRLLYVYGNGLIRLSRV